MVAGEVHLVAGEVHMVAGKVHLVAGEVHMVAGKVQLWLQARDARLPDAILPHVLLIRSGQARRDRGLMPG